MFSYDHDSNDFSLVYEEECRFNSNAYRRRVPAACTIINIPLYAKHTALSNLIVVVLIEEHGDLFISFSLS